MRFAWSAPILLCVLTACTGTSAAVAHSRFDSQATESLTQIEHGNCEATASKFDATMKRALTPSGLCAGFLTYTQQFGALSGTGAAYSTKRGQLTVVRVPLTLIHSEGEFRISYHPDGTIAGVYFLKPGIPLP